MIKSVQKIITFKSMLCALYVIVFIMVSAILFWLCLSTLLKNNVFICKNYAFFENSIIEGTIVGMVFFNLCTKCRCIFFKCVFCFDSFFFCGAYTEVCIVKFRKMVNKYCGNVIFSTCFLSFENCDYNLCLIRWKWEMLSFPYFDVIHENFIKCPESEMFLNR